MSKVSIIVPIYNPGKKLNRCIKSILKQTFKEFELILVNDGSTDNSLQICKDYHKNDNRIRIIDKQNEGSILTRKRGVQEAKYEYVMFVDSDDWVDKKIVEILYNEAINNLCDVAVCNIYKVIGDRAIIKRKNNSEFFYEDKIYEGNSIKEELAGAYFHGHPFPSGMCAKLYKKELLLSSGNYLKNIKFLGDDLYYNLEIFLKAKKVKIINKSLYYYRVGGYTTKYMPYHFDDIVNGFDIQKQVIDNFYEDTKKKRYKGICVMLLNSLKLSLSNIMNSKFTELEKKQIIRNYVLNNNILEAISNEDARVCFDDGFLNAIENIDIHYLYNLGNYFNTKSKKRKYIINMISKLNIL